MPELVIGNRRYHLVKRIIVRLELRTADAEHEIIAEAESICRAGDKFNERLGTILAFRGLMRELGRHLKMKGLWHLKASRASTWAQAWPWINGVKRPVVKMRKQSAIAKALAAQNNKTPEKV